MIIIPSNMSIAKRIGADKTNGQSVLILFKDSKRFGRCLAACHTVPGFGMSIQPTVSAWECEFQVAVWRLCPLLSCKRSPGHRRKVPSTAPKIP